MLLNLFFRHKHTEHSRADFARLSLYFVIDCSFVYLFTVCIGICLHTYLIKISSELFLINILLLANIFAGIYSNFSSWYKLADKNYLNAWISFAGMLFNDCLEYYFNSIIWAMLHGIYESGMLFIYLCFVVFSGQKYFPIPYKMWENELLSACMYFY